MLRLKKGGSLPNLVGIALMLLATVATAQTTVADRPVVLDSARLVAGESKPIQWPLRDTPINSVISVRSSPELAFPIRINLGANGSLPFQLIVPPTTPPGEYELEITGQADNGRPLSANLHLTVGAVVVPKTVTARPPVILLNGFEILCDANSTGTFDQMAALLEAESVPVLFFNNCAYGDYSIETLAGLLKSYIAGLTYTDGTPVTQVDLVAHSMGGLIVRAYLSGLQPGDSSFVPPANPGVRKAIFIATPHFGSFQAGYIGVQESEMVLGSRVLWDLATWNQRHDDLRGVDALAIIGNAGVEGSLNGASDGVVSLTSASLSFAESDQRTRIVPYCHITPGLLTPLGMSCYAPNKGIAYIDSASHMTFQIVDSFLAGNSNWQSIGHPPSLDTAGYLSQYGGFIFGETSAAGAQINLGQAAFGSVNLQNSPSSDGLFYNEFVSGTGNFTTSAPGAISCGPFTEPPGYYSAVRCKPSPQISNVGPLLQNAPGWVVASGAAITISGIGFGQTRCSACQVLAYPGPVALQISSWSDTAITATLPSTFSGFAQVFVQNAVGQDYINIMAAAIPSSLTIQTNPSGLQFSIDGGPLQTAPQTLSLSAGSTHTVAVSLTQLGAAVGTQYAFLSWSDGGAATHTFVVNSSGTLTAAYKTQYQLTTSAVPASGGTVSPASGGYYDAGTVVSLTATANSGYLFSAWSGTVANAGSVSTTVTMSNLQTVTANFKAANIPIISSSGVVPLDSSIPVIQPGSWISIYGSNLANSTVVWNDDFPLSLGGVSVTINKKPGYLWFVSPGQINLQAPDDSATGLVPVVVTTPNGTATSTVTLAASGPSFSLFNSRYAAGVILTPNGSGAYDGGVYDLLGPVAFFNFNTRPVKAGEVLELYGVGFGPTSPPVPAGQVFGGAAPTVQPVTVAIGGVSATVLFSGLTIAGLYQLNVVVPNVASGDQPLQAIVSGGIQTPAGVYITVQ